MNHLTTDLPDPGDCAEQLSAPGIASSEACAWLRVRAPDCAGAEFVAQAIERSAELHLDDRAVSRTIHMGSEQMGVVCIHRFHARPAYARTANAMLWIEEGYRTRGVLERLWDWLSSDLRALGYAKIIVMLPEAVADLCAALTEVGFRCVGSLPSIPAIAAAAPGADARVSMLLRDA